MFNKKRKIIQIAPVYIAANNKVVVFALCNDGTVWHSDPKGVWIEVIDIPQPEEEKDND